MGKCMDGREGMPSFYLNRGFRGSGSNVGSGNQAGGFHLPPPGFKTQSNPNLSPHGHSNMGIAQPPMGLPFHMEHNPSPNLSNFPHGINIGGGGNGGGNDDGVGVGGGGVSISNVVSGSETVVKKKRGRPRKYAPDGANMALGLTPVSSGAIVAAVDDRSTPPPQKKRGRPRGSGRKQRLANVGMFFF